MNKIYTFMQSIKLTLTQWVIVSLAATVGLLVAALRLQGSRLHYAQLQLLEANYNAQDQTDDEAVAKAKEAYKKALDSYNAN